MSEKKLFYCALCDIEKDEKICIEPDGRGPGFCPTVRAGEIVDEAMLEYEKKSTREFARQASLQEAACYEHSEAGRGPIKTRVEEVCEFTNRMGYKRLGIAFCSGLIYEAKILNNILTARGFEVVSVMCKAGAVPKEKIGIKDSEKIVPGTYETMCNPIAQAKFLNSAGTEFNIVMGLCVGHDSLFLKHIEAYTTVLVVKDRVMGHNPIAALYTSGSYYTRVFGPEKQSGRASS